uniref:Uncharacterized protein n=1 Tax=viral metagenome TaxID=1070528 RepID=A0A6C0JIY5_9ZZZZ
MGSLGVDLTGLANIQQAILTSLQNKPASDTTVSPQISSVQTALTDLFNAFGTATDTSSATLDHQTEMNNIVTTENERLKKKKALVDQALEGKQRALELNDSYRQKYSYYTKATMLVVFFLILFILLNMLSQYLPFIPSFVFDILYFFLGLTVVLTVYFIYLDIIWRDNMNFNELNFTAPHRDSPDEIQAKIAQSSKMGDLLNTINVVGCVGETCCNPLYTKWDKGNLMCTGKEAFTTMNIEYSGKIILPNSPNEFESYARA